MFSRIAMLLIGIGVIQSYADITVACAANMQYAMKEIAAVYKEKTGKSVSPVFGSAGKLSAQILNGAPFDVFVSADMERGDSLYAKGYAKTKSRTYALGSLVLWTLRPDLDLSQWQTVLKSEKIKSIAIGDLKLTVYGPAAHQVLENTGLWKTVEPKIVYGENINTVAQYIISQSADIGFSNLSFTQKGPMAGKGKWIELDPKWYDPLPQGAVILRYGMDNNPEESKAFYDFLFGPQSRSILKSYGYLLP